MNLIDLKNEVSKALKQETLVTKNVNVLGVYSEVYSLSLLCEEKKQI
jgi:hypothetical protein